MKTYWISLVHLGEPKEQWFESYSFYPKHGYHEYKPRYMKKRFIDLNIGGLQNLKSELV